MRTRAAARSRSVALATSLLFVASGLSTAPPSVAGPADPSTVPAQASASRAGPPSAPPVGSARPLVWQSEVADPSVVEWAGGFLAVSTGFGVPTMTARGSRGRWRPLAPALATTPSWVLPGELWAPQLHEVADGSWVLYYSALAAGLPPGGRCIGAATAATAAGPFTPAGDAPLVCPPRYGAPPATDELLDRDADLPISGVIDPSTFTERDGRLYLLYKTQGLPSTLRMVLLTPDGLAAVPNKRSRMLLRSNGIVENPTLVRRDSRYVLFASEGWYGDCDYRTTYRKSSNKWRWPAGSTNFLGPVLTGLCGPGGADVVAPAKRGRVRIFFHGWVCYQTDQACPRDFRRDRDTTQLPRRGMYAALLDWGRSDSPQVVRYLTPK